MDNLSLKGIPLKRSQSWEIANLVAQPQELGLNQKPPNQRAFNGLAGQGCGPCVVRGPVRGRFLV
jgi:hypothetical protein